MSEEISNEEVQKRLEMIKQNCIFCKIANKEMDSKIVFEDEKCLAVLDIHPATTGHILLFPKEHYMMMPMVPNEVLGHLNFIAKSLCPILIETLNSNDITVFIANGAAAGQQSQHFMLHLIPRYEEDGLDFDLKNKNGRELNELEIETLKNNLIERLNKSNNP